MPANFQGFPGEGNPYASRRIATLSGTKRDWSVYIFKYTLTHKLTHKKRGPYICLFVFTRFQGSDRGAGGGCSRSVDFFGPGRDVVASSSRVVAGVTSDRVARVVIIGSRGVAHEIPLSRDEGFIFNCRAYNGCSCVTSRLQAFDKHGTRIENQDWGSSAPNCRRK